MIEAAHKRLPISGLDLIRFFAAFIVLAYHLAFWSWAAPYETTAVTILDGAPVAKGLSHLSWFGAVGVDIFFVLSGFVIIYSASSDSRSFARSRVLRLLPGAIICATIGALVMAWADALPPLSILKRYAATVIFWPTGPWIDGVYWTLGIEIAFYGMIFALIRFASIDRLRLVLYPIGLASSLFWALSLGFGLREYVETNLGMEIVRLLRLALLYDGNLFALGGLIWASFYSRGRFDWIVMALCAFTAAIHIGEDQAWQAAKAGASIAMPIAVWSLCVGAIFLSVRFNSVVSKVVPGRLARNLGIATYPLYLLHNTFGPAVMNAAFRMTGSAGFALFVAMVGCCALALLVASVGEPPIRRLAGGIFDRVWRARPAVGPPLLARTL